MLIVFQGDLFLLIASLVIFNKSKRYITDKILRITFISIALSFFFMLNLSVTNENISLKNNHSEHLLSSCISIISSAEAQVFPGSIVNGHELSYEYPEMWDAGVVALCYNVGLDCLIEGEVPDLYD